MLSLPGRVFADSTFLHGNHSMARISYPIPKTRYFDAG